MLKIGTTFASLMLCFQLNAQHYSNNKLFSKLDTVIVKIKNVNSNTYLEKVITKIQPTYNFMETETKNTYFGFQYLKMIKKNAQFDIFAKCSSVGFYTFWKEGLTPDDRVTTIECAFKKQEDCHQAFLKLRKNQSKLCVEELWAYPSLILETEDKLLYIVAYGDTLKKDSVIKKIIDALIEDVKVRELSISE